MEPGFLTLLPLQTEKEMICGPELEHALKEPVAGKVLPDWGCLEALIWTDRDLSFLDLQEKTTTEGQTDIHV